MKVITDDFRQYFGLSEEECKQYHILEDPEELLFLSEQRDRLLMEPSVFFQSGFLPDDKQNPEAKWIITEATETETGIILQEGLIRAVTAGILICLKVDSGRYHTLSETAKKWFICTGKTEVPKKYWIKY